MSDTETSTQTARLRNALAGAVGNALEWYDFAIYGSLAPIIGNLFFPSGDPLTSLLASFGVFAVGYAARPVGGVILGSVGDRIGRKTTLIISVSLMGVGTTLIGLLPTYEQIGLAAPVLLILLRLMQGVSVGGEYPGSVVFLAEHAPQKSRALFTSWPVIGAFMGFLIGNGAAAILGGLIGDDALEQWGWRIPFLLGALIAVGAVVFRRHMSEPPTLGRLEVHGDIPFVEAVRDYWRQILQIICLTLSLAVGFYLLFVFASSYLTEYMHISTSSAFDINTYALMIMIPIIGFGAYVSDHIGRKPLLYTSSIGTLILSWPLWSVMHHENVYLVFIGQAGFATLFAIGYSALSSAMVEALPAHVRCSGVAIGYNLCQGLFGGTAPLVATYLLARTADDFAPVYYLIITAMISTIAVYTLKETTGKPLPD
ncbi:MFS transporter [Hoeflea sp. CAU 1731]